jgi:hypothetical protein
MILKRRGSSHVTPPDELAFLSLLDGTAPPADHRLHQGEVELKIPGTGKWRPAKMILTKEHLIMCASAATAGIPSHGVRRQGWLEKLEKQKRAFLYKQWKKRYFTLTDAALLYAKGAPGSEHDAHECEVPLNSIINIEKADGTGRDRCLEVATNLFQGDGKRRVYLLQVLWMGWVGLRTLKMSYVAFLLLHRES